MSKSKLEIINETVEYIKENGRALHRNGITCVYQTEEGIGCAVGRCLDKSKYREEFEENNVNNLVTDILEGDLDKYLKKEYRGHNISFWSDLQKLHDEHTYWTSDKGLSDSGKKQLKRLRKIHSNEN